MEVTGEGFVLGEDVAAVVVVADTDATGAGHARALLLTWLRLVRFRQALHDGLDVVGHGGGGVNSVAGDV